MPIPTVLVFGSTGAIGGSVIQRLMLDLGAHANVDPAMNTLGIDQDK